MEALERLSSYLPGTKQREGWTATAPLPGGDLDVSALPALTAELLRDFPFLSPNHASRLAHAYGPRAVKVLGHATSIHDLGRSFGATLTESEVKYLIAHEWACTAEDIVWRRSKLGLHVPVDAAAKIDAYLAKKKVAAVAAQ